MGLPVLLSSVAIVFLATLISTAQDNADLTGSVLDVRQFGATGDGKTDDTQAIQAAFDKANRQARTADVRGASLILPKVVIPMGVYRITDTIAIQGGGSHIVGEGNAVILMEGSDKDIFASKNAWRLSIKGITFAGGRKHLALVNPNIDSGHITIEGCRFHDSAEEAVELSLRSTIVYIEKCVFLRCEQALTTTTDMTTIRDTWIMSKESMTDKAVIKARGDMMMLDNLCLVPLPGAIRQRWVDNYNGMFLSVRNVRFGGEGGGFTPIYNFAKVRTMASGPNILIDQSFVAANASYDANAAVYCVEVPNKIEIRSSNLQGAKPVIIDKAIDLNTCFSGGSPALLSFTSENNIGEFRDDIPELLRHPVCPSDPTTKSGLTDEATERLLDESECRLKTLNLPDAAGEKTSAHAQKTGLGEFVNLGPSSIAWSLDDKMDATQIPNSFHLAFRNVGSDVVVMRRTTTAAPDGGGWPHVLIGPVELNIDQHPWLTWKQKDPGIESPRAYAVRIVHLESGSMTLLKEQNWPPYYDYNAYDLRDVFSLKGGKHSFLIKLYYLGLSPVEKEYTHSKSGDYMLLDFLRAESD